MFFQSIESDKKVESDFKDIEQEKEPAFGEEERHAQDAVEKDLQLTIDTSEADEMSMLNPDAKEFVPISPTRSNGPLSPPLNGEMNPVNPLLSTFVDDAVMAQSPRKGEFQPMEDVTVPSELDFGSEADVRPHEFDLLGASAGLQRIESPELLNLKESMQQDDKLEQEYKDEAQTFFEEEKLQTSDDYKGLESSFNEYSNGFQNVIDDPMNRSFYEGRDDGDILTASADLLNSVQPIPTFEDDQPEDDQVVEGSHESILDFNKPADASPAPPMHSSDHFEPERFVEEIKSANSEFDKYVDQGLSPTLPDFSHNVLQDMEEAKLDMEQPAVADIALPEEPKVELPSVEQFDIPEAVEPAAAAVEPPKEEDLKVEVVAGAAVAAAAVAGIVAAKKKPTTAAGKPSEVKKADAKAKLPAASKPNPVPAKRAPITAPKAPVTKPSSAPAPAKPPAARKIVPAAAKPAPKPPVPSAPISRPKPATSTAAPIRKPAATDGAAARPTPASRTTTVAAKKPATSLAATK